MARTQRCGRAFGSNCLSKGTMKKSPGPGISQHTTKGEKKREKKDVVNKGKKKRV